MNVLSALLVAAVTWFPADDWVDEPDPVASPRARKGGLMRFNGSQPPKSFNYYIDNNAYSFMMFALMYEPLITLDSQTLEFSPVIARRWGVSDDNREFTFVIDERAKWSDGEPITAEDVRWTFDQLMAPMSDTGVYKSIYDVYEPPEVLDVRTVRFRVKAACPVDWRYLMNCGELHVMPKHYFGGKDFNKLDLLDAPVSGPYRISKVSERVFTEYSRVTNWWRADFPSSRGVYNFDRIVMRYYMTNENAFDALKKNMIDVYPVYVARIMNYETLGEKFQKNWIVKRRVKNHKPTGYQGFCMNMRHWPFDDVRVRRAMSKLIDRELMNRTLMNNEYFMLRSFYTEIYDEEHPCANDLILYDFEGAAALLREAGFEKDAKGRLCKDGRPFVFTFLSRAATEDRTLAPFRENLMKLGIDMKIERCDFANWMKQMDAFNFDMTWASMVGSTIKAPEYAWLSSEADRQGSSNRSGFKSARVDELIAAEKTMMKMSDRIDVYREIDALVAAEVPYAFLWTSDNMRLLYWNRFGMPDTVVDRISDETSIPAYWWYDPDRDAELQEAVDEGKCLPSVPLWVNYDEVMKQNSAK